VGPIKVVAPVVLVDQDEVVAVDVMAYICPLLLMAMSMISGNPWWLPPAWPRRS